MRYDVDVCRHHAGQKRLSGAAAMAVAAAQKRAAVSAPAEVSLNTGTPEPPGPAASGPLQQLQHRGRVSAGIADAPDRPRRSDAKKISPDTDAASIVGEAASRALSDNAASIDYAGYATHDGSIQYILAEPFCHLLQIR